MTRSMTGFGRATGEIDGEQITVELSAVNHRFFECSFRLPYSWAALEPVLRECVKKHIDRGKVNISIRRERGLSGRQSIRFDVNAAKQYISAARELAGLMNTTESLSLNTLARLEGVFFQEEDQQDLDRVNVILGAALVDAVTQFNGAREAEGAALVADITERIRQMQEAVDAIDARLPELSAAYEQRLRDRMAELNAEAGLKEERIALEVAMMAEKSDVNEEIVRLRTHFEQALNLLNSEVPIGRELNFLSQEIQRESNTLGSKLRDIGVTREVLRIKSELEKLREQIQNLE